MQYYNNDFFTMLVSFSLHQSSDQKLLKANDCLKEAFRIVSGTTVYESKIDGSKLIDNSHFVSESV